MHSSLWSHETNTCFLNLALWSISLDDFKLVSMFEVLHRLVDHHWCSCEVSKRGWLSPCLPHMWGHSHCGIFNVGYFRMIYYQNDSSENFLKPHRRTPMSFFLPCWCFYRINAVSNGQVRGDSYSEGCLGQTGMWQVKCCSRISNQTWVFK